MITYEPGISAELCVDLYNDFLSERGNQLILPNNDSLPGEIGLV